MGFEPLRPGSITAGAVCLGGARVDECHKNHGAPCRTLACSVDELNKSMAGADLNKGPTGEAHPDEKAIQEVGVH
jgi:hypothetical protein